MNTDKAYLLGLVIGGGVWGNAEDTFRIKLPYRQWGSYEENPRRAGEISRDIMTVVSPMFRSVYDIIVSFEATPATWNILCDGDTTKLKNDLHGYGILCEGELRNNVSVDNIIDDLSDDFMKRRFIAGLADTIGSTNKNHRRFTDDVQIISFELKGFNFSFVCALCRLLYSIGCYPDQILWNHPNFHATNNPYYRAWKKGHKLRVQLDQYASFGAFAFATKARSAEENRQLQSHSNEAIPCPERDVRAKISCVHPAEHDINLPESIRGGHYLHNRHVCAVLGCEHAPYAAIRGLFPDVGNLINPFPILCKDTFLRIEEIINNEPLLANREYATSRVTVKMLYSMYQEDNSNLLYGTNGSNGYPITEIIQGIAYIIADEDDLNGARVKGPYTELIERYLSVDETLSVEMRKPDLLTPLVFAGNGRGVLVGARNPAVYRSLVCNAPDNEYKLHVREISEGDLRNA